MRRLNALIPERRFLRFEIANPSKPARLAMAKHARKATFKQRPATEVAESAMAVTPSLERQQWLERAAEALRGRFADAGYQVPGKLRFAIGWPKRSASCGAIGECWTTEASSDQHFELFISPEL